MQILLGIEKLESFLIVADAVK